MMNAMNLSLHHLQEKKLCFSASLFMSAQVEQCPGSFHSRHNTDPHCAELHHSLGERGAFVLSRADKVFPFLLPALMVHLLASHAPPNYLFL